MHIDQTLQKEEPTYTAFGFKGWTVNGQHHRIDGPAITFTNGHREWYVNGKRKIKNSSFQKAANLSDEDMTAMILKYGNVE